MGKAYDGKKRWNDTIRRTTAAAATASAGVDPRRSTMKKRFSGRTHKLSKAMKDVDEETRAIVRNARLDALEADNYGEDDGLGLDGELGEADELYVDEDEAGGGGKAPVTATSSKRARGKKNSSAPRARRWKVKSLAQLVFEEHGTGSDSATPTYLSVAVGPSVHPARKFCVVCGFFAPYACKRCGSRFCRARCGDQHQESGCLKFGL